MSRKQQTEPDSDPKDWPARKTFANQYYQTAKNVATTTVEGIDSLKSVDNFEFFATLMSASSYTFVDHPIDRTTWLHLQRHKDLPVKRRVMNGMKEDMAKRDVELKGGLDLYKIRKPQVKPFHLKMWEGDEVVEDNDDQQMDTTGDGDEKFEDAGVQTSVAEGDGEDKV
ncbi:hypothetical protein LTR70_001058 [Exophiala xenobiotica]|uniref:Uncharacterized protein n=1 Tax=Lithohypha guttulata TaxID=1690604 RepID=A0ABR0KMV3_9EURO|nr:hypothetical protein LTR24_000753 [Lithohypha guttulata]KAK5328904.1 hypothetical protein LTR70_001058 [Exophiala xenobiotica]